MTRSASSDQPAASPRLFVDPPMQDWSLPRVLLCEAALRCEARAGAEQFSGPDVGGGRQTVLQLANENAKRLGLPAASDADTPVIASGHQPWLWHPGILAKEMAMRVAADRFEAQTLHLVVDQDVHPALEFEYPIVEGDQLSLGHCHLAEENHLVPAGFQPPADVKQIVQQLKSAKKAAPDDLADGFDRLVAVFTDLPGCRTLAEQLAVVLHRLKQPLVGDVPVIFTTDLAGTDAFKSLVDAMLHDARHFAEAYNQAVAEYPEADMTRLIEHRMWVELPLWACAWQSPRQRVFADLTDSTPMLVLPDSTPLDRDAHTILPRALCMTALLRSRFTDLFIHGKGGGLYDRVTESWWQAWRNESLLPRATVSADVYLDFAVPVSNRNELFCAQWYRHWLPHNLDRVAKVDASLAAEKKQLLAHMDDNRDKKRRRDAFNRIHEINDRFVASHPEKIDQADKRLRRARRSLVNAQLARKRDWPFALYPQEKLRELFKQM